MSSAQSISLIIPVLNEYQALQNLVPDLIKKNGESHLELLFCDGGSADITTPYIRSLKQRYAEHEFISITLIECSRGRAQQMNAGAKQASHSLLLFLHADTQLPKSWQGLVANKQWGRFDVRLSGHHFLFRMIEAMMNFRSCVTQVATGDQAIFVKKDLFDQVGGFPELPLMEDIALSKVLRQHAKIACIKEPLVTSSRRWERNGIIKTMVLMWLFRGSYFLGVNPQRLADRYYPSNANKRARAVVQVFSKLPILGYVKTRLIPNIGAQSATDIHRYLLKHTLKIVSDSQIKHQLWVAQEKHHSRVKHDEFRYLETSNQQGSDLGERMGNAIELGLKSFKKVVLIGTDCLDYHSSHIEQSLSALDEVDVVFTPVTDGGFISIACRVFDKKIFAGVAWGTEHALSGVLKNLKLLSLHYKLLEPVRDIDTYNDVLEYPELIELIK